MALHHCSYCTKHYMLNCHHQTLYLFFSRLLYNICTAATASIPPELTVIFLACIFVFCHPLLRLYITFFLVLTSQYLLSRNLTLIQSHPLWLHQQLGCLRDLVMLRTVMNHSYIHKGHSLEDNVPSQLQHDCSVLLTLSL